MTDWSAFAASLGDIPTERDPLLVKLRSRDFYWYSPVLKRQLRDATGDPIVMSRNEAEAIETVARCFAAGQPRTVSRQGRQGIFRFLSAPYCFGKNSVVNPIL
jgi:hypothetical protein